MPVFLSSIEIHMSWFAQASTSTRWLQFCQWHLCTFEGHMWPSWIFILMTLQDIVFSSSLVCCISTRTWMKPFSSDHYVTLNVTDNNLDVHFKRWLLNCHLFYKLETDASQLHFGVNVGAITRLSQRNDMQLHKQIAMISPYA